MKYKHAIVGVIALTVVGLVGVPAYYASYNSEGIVPLPPGITYANLRNIVAPYLTPLAETVETSVTAPWSVNFDMTTTSPTRLVGPQNPKPLFPMTLAHTIPIELDHMPPEQGEAGFYSLKDGALAILDHSADCGTPFERSTFTGSEQDKQKLLQGSHAVSAVYDQAYLCKNHLMLSIASHYYQSVGVTFDPLFLLKPEIGQPREICLDATMHSTLQSREGLNLKFVPPQSLLASGSTVNGIDATDWAAERIGEGGPRQAFYIRVDAHGPMEIIGADRDLPYAERAVVYPENWSALGITAVRNKRVEDLFSEYSSAHGISPSILPSDIRRDKVCVNFSTTDGTDFIVKSYMPTYDSKEISYVRFNRYPLSTKATQVQLSCDAYNFLNPEYFGELANVGNTWHIDNITMSHAINTEVLHALKSTLFHPPMNLLHSMPYGFGAADGIATIEFEKIPRTGSFLRFYHDPEVLVGASGKWPDDQVMSRPEISFDGGLSWTLPRPVGHSGAFFGSTTDATATIMANTMVGNPVSGSTYLVAIPEGTGQRILVRSKGNLPGDSRYTFFNIFNPVAIWWPPVGSVQSQPTPTPLPTNTAVPTQTAMPTATARVTTPTPKPVSTNTSTPTATPIGRTPIPTLAPTKISTPKSGTVTPKPTLIPTVVVTAEVTKTALPILTAKPIVSPTPIRGMQTPPGTLTNAPDVRLTKLRPRTDKSFISQLRSKIILQYPGLNQSYYTAQLAIRSSLCRQAVLRLLLGKTVLRKVTVSTNKSIPVVFRIPPKNKLYVISAQCKLAKGAIAASSDVKIAGLK